MLSLFGIAQKYAHILLFIFIEIICLNLIVRFNSNQNSIIKNSASQVSGSIFKQTSRLNELLDLEKDNARLAAENAELIREVIVLSDKLNNQKKQDEEFVYDVTSAKILSQSIRSLRNTIIINKGQQDSLKTDMGIITLQGVVGKLTSVSTNYSSGLSLLNIDTRISATLKSNNYYGTITWPGNSISELELQGIPNHASISVGDTIVTNGYSTIFPPNIVIGTVIDWSLEKSGEYFNVKVEPSVSYGNLDNVYIINNLSSTELKELNE